MEKVYPSCRYHPEKESVLVMSAEHEKDLGFGWHESPAEFGIETEPGFLPDPVIAEKRAKFLAGQAQALTEEPKEDLKKRGKRAGAKE